MKLIKGFLSRFLGFEFKDSASVVRRPEMFAHSMEIAARHLQPEEANERIEFMLAAANFLQKQSKT